MLLRNQGTLTVSDLKRLDAVGDSLLIQAAVKSGAAQIFYTTDDTLVILQVDRGLLVVLAVVGQNAVVLTHTLISLARSMNLEALWYCTKRSGMQRLLKDFVLTRFENGYKVAL